MWKTHIKNVWKVLDQITREGYEVSLLDIFKGILDKDLLGC